MKLTKVEAIVLNIWEEIKNVLDIKEGEVGDVKRSLEKLYPNGASFLPEVELYKEFSPSFEVTLSSGEMLILSKRLQERDNLHE